MHDYEIYTVSVASPNTKTPITNNEYNDQFPTWSPDSTRIAFASQRNGNWDIFSIRADGSGSDESRLTSHTEEDTHPAWSPDPNRRPPAVTTADATSVLSTTARLNGNLSYLGSSSAVSVSFQWRTPSGTWTETPALSKTSTGTFYYNLTNLAPNQTYYFRAKASGHGTSYGEEKSFTTAPLLPGVTTNDATDKTSSSARLNGNLTSLGSATSVNVSFQWGTSPGSYTYETTPQAVSATGPFSADLFGLQPGRTYYFVAKAVGQGTGYGIEKSFATSIAAPAVTNSTGVSNIASTTARLNGEITNTGGENPTVHIYWGDNDGGTTPPSQPGGWDNDVNLGTSSVGTFYTDISTLKPNTDYYYRCYATNSAGSNWAATTSQFKTPVQAQKLIGHDDASFSGY
jgi:hypothetical protein